ncbi:MAG: methyltransferase family protein [Betaproteobacteria bacterium]
MVQHEAIPPGWTLTVIEPKPAYGLWMLAAVNAAVFIIFALSFATPRTKRDWRSFGAFSAFVIALFAEMYGFPLTLYLVSGWLGNLYPEVDFLGHDAGHLLEMFFGWGGDPHYGPFHIASYLLLAGGFILLARSWGILYEAQRRGELATTGPYARVRHPQYAGFVLIMSGFLLQWPTLLTLVMFPVLVWMYVRLSPAEEAQARRTFGIQYERYAECVPRFVPRLRVETLPASRAEPE